MTEREYVVVPPDERLDVDEGEGADATEGGLDNEDLGLYRTELAGEVITESLG